MKPRNRQFISQSFAIKETQLQWLEFYCAMASKQIGAKVSVSELIRLLIDQFIEQQNTGAVDPAPVQDDSTSQQ